MPDPTTAAGGRPTPQLSRQALDRIIETIQRRVLDELERRGTWTHEGVH